MPCVQFLRISRAHYELNALFYSAEIKERNWTEIKISTRRRSTNQSTVQRYFIQLYKKFGRDEKIFCRLCSKNIFCGNGSTVGIDYATALHFGKILFTCWYCSEGRKSLQGILGHIKRCHQKSGTGGYVDLCQKYESEIMALLTKCFEKEEKIKRIKKWTPVGQRKSCVLRKWSIRRKWRTRIQIK